jgi:hypothetical protein
MKNITVIRNYSAFTDSKDLPHRMLCILKSPRRINGGSLVSSAGEAGTAGER